MTHKLLPQPSVEELEAELKRERYKRRYHSVFRSTVYTLITVAAIAVLVATLWMPVLQIYGSSMSPTLQDGEIIFTVKTSDFKPGDIAAFYYNNKILVKRIICGPGTGSILMRTARYMSMTSGWRSRTSQKRHWASAILNCPTKSRMAGILSWGITEVRR